MVHEGEKSFECDLCESKFTQKESLKAHIASVHEYEKLLEYDICENAFTQKENLKVHSASIHEWESLFECDMWFIIYPRKMLKDHIASVHERKNPLNVIYVNQNSHKKEM